MTTLYVTHPRYTEHDSPGHPEHAGRIRAVWQRLEEAGLPARMTQTEATPIDDEAILSVHAPEYLDVLRRVSAQPRQMRLDADTYAGQDALAIAKLSAGGVVDAVDAVLAGRADNALAAVRPPGHHAMPDHGMGFCLLGNVPIAAKFAQRQYGISRVLIVDYDVHHGNGTEAMFYDDPSVLFISTHQYPLYPGTGAVTDTGANRGMGYTINVPLPPGSGDAQYAAIFEDVVWKAARRFAPELIIVSAGFDAHWSDPLAQIRLTLNGYAHLTRELMTMAAELCGGRIVFALEGGYDLDALGLGMANVARLLVGDEATDPLGTPPDMRATPDITALVEQLRRVHKL